MSITPPENPHEPRPEPHPGGHLYISTACHHGLHEDRCRLHCKFCHAPCLCPCHLKDTT